ncbi:MAG: c-type cytochrome [Piscinibacter sp.]|nr:c-type cytochrome [Piscinibacter sp.]
MVDASAVRVVARTVSRLGAGLAMLISAAAAAAAPLQDSIAERVAPCTACHGQEGRAAPDGYYPRIAGKPAGYLHQQLRNFREGRRRYGPMVYLVDPLDDAYLAEIAAYFAGLDLPYPPPRPPAAEPAVLARGEQLAREGDPARRLPACADCHGTQLLGVAPAVPGLLGLPPDYLRAQLGAWVNGQRRALAPDCMATIAERLTPQDVAALAAWLAGQPVPAGAHPAARPERRAPLECGGMPP